MSQRSPDLPELRLVVQGGAVFPPADLLLVLNDLLGDSFYASVFL